MNAPGAPVPMPFEPMPPRADLPHSLFTRLPHALSYPLANHGIRGSHFGREGTPDIAVLHLIPP